MAEVILAEMSAGHGVTKLAALKRIWPELAAEPDFVAMFLREARISARMNHPNVVQTYEVLDDTDRPTIAMEYLDGQPLTRVMDRLSRKGGLTLTLRLRIFANVLGALDYAHELTDYDGTLRGVVHRDVNPHNVFITYDGRVKLLDFGLAKSLSATYQTRPGNVGGRLAYMAPEQLRGGPIDRRADVFSAGVLLWELASGRRLWHGATESTIIRDLTSGAPIRPLPPDGNLPIGLDKICARALAIDPEARFATAAEFQAEIERFLPGCDDSHGRHLGKIVALAFAEERAPRRSLIEGHVRANHRAIETDMSERGTRGDGTRSARNAGVWAEDDGTLATGVIGGVLAINPAHELIHKSGRLEPLVGGVLLTSVEKLAGYARKNSLWPATFGLACCASEMMATGAGRYDLARFGMEVFRASPRQADLMIVAGRVSQKMAPVLRQVYDQMPEPKWVISMGVCASSGGMFNNYAIVQGVDHVVPVDVYLPGCPPRPEMLLNAIITLHEQIQNTPLGVNRVAAAHAAEAAALAATPTHDMKGLLA